MYLYNDHVLINRQGELQNYFSLEIFFKTFSTTILRKSVIILTNLEMPAFRYCHYNSYVLLSLVGELQFSFIFAFALFFVFYSSSFFFKQMPVKSAELAENVLECVSFKRSFKNLWFSSCIFS